MPAAASPPPPFSVRGTIAGLRWPTPGDVLFSVKAALAAILALAVGFSQDLDNPYWAGLTIYILVAQPEAGAIRSKALFRLVGTVCGGAGAVLLAALFGSHVGVLLIATVACILLTYWLKTLDRTPVSYLWFSFALTLAVIGVIHGTQPPTIFGFATTRTAESCLGILAIFLVDSVVLPRAATPAFLVSMSDWRARAAEWACAALRRDAGLDPDARLARRVGLRKLAALLTPLDALGVQLPYDIVPVPPRGRDLRYLRMTVVHLIAQLSAANSWIEAGRRGGAGAPAVDAAADEIAAHLAERPDFADPAIVDHAERGEALAQDLAARAHAIAAAGDRTAVLQASVVLRLSELAGYWSRLEHVMRAIATGRRMPPVLRAEARRARPVRSIDYLVAAIDVAPLALALATVLAVWYLTAWTGGINAMLFAFVVCAFTIGTPGVVRSARGALGWVCLAFAITFFYLYVALPRVTAFPLLAAVLAAGLVPLGIFMAMAPAGVLVTANGFALLGLQNAYAADFQSSLQSLLGSLAGCLAAVVALYLCQYDRPRFRARRLARAIDRDVVDLARSRRALDRGRMLSLTVDRIAMFFAIVDALPDGDPLKAIDIVARLRVATNLLALREHERDHAAAARAAVTALRTRVAAAYRHRDGPDREALLPLVEAAYDALLAEPEGLYRRRGLAALTGLSVALTPDPAFEAKMRGGAG